MPRRFELGLAPLLARLGLTRPDENPLALSDDVRPVYVVGGAPTAVPGAGGRMQIARFDSGVVGAGIFGTCIIGPPSGGAWLHSIYLTTGGSAAFLSFENTTTFAPGFLGTGSFGQVGRLDARETADPLKGQAGTSTGLVSPAMRVDPFARFTFGPTPTWWYGLNADSITPLALSGRITIQCDTATEQLSVDVMYETPLYGVRRQTS